MFDIITFGSATQDIFVSSKDFGLEKNSKFRTGAGLCMSAGSKLYVDDVLIQTGGGGTNSAVTFALQDFKTAYVGKVGDDSAGRALIEELKSFGIETKFVKIDKENKTALSIILVLPDGERTILVYQGACNELKKEDISFGELEAKWIYMSGLSGSCSGLFEPIVNFAHEKGIRIAINPGKDQLELGQDALRPILQKINVLILNQEEASILCGADYKNEKELFRKLDELVPGIVVMTKGPKGVTVSDGKNLYSAGVPKSEVIDRTGAGDSFGSGFVAGLIQQNDISHAIKLATANATSNVAIIGAKTGLLKKGEWGRWEKVEIVKSLI